MQRICWILTIVFAVTTGVFAGASFGGTDDDVAALYTQHCASCHGAKRLGGMGPALLPQNLKRLKREAAIRVITEGSVATQMPAFGGVLTDAVAQALGLTVPMPNTERGMFENFGAKTRIRDIAGGLLVLGALVGFFEALMRLRAHDYIAGFVIIMAGLGVMGAGVELLRPTVGE